MTTAYTPILKLALPVTGELNGTWGTVVNDNITSMVEQAVAGLATINTWTANSHTLTTADGTTSESRCAMLVIDDDGAGNPSAAATVICPTATKSYIVRNLCGQTVTIRTSAGTGVAIPNNQAALVFCDGTNVVTGAFNGDVVGPATSTNNAIVTFDGTTGKLIKDNSGATISAGVITATGVSTGQVDITAQGDLRLQDTTGGEYVALQAPSTIATSYTLTLPVDDGTAGQALITDGSGVLSWSSAASGDVYGPASATDNAVARFDSTTGKIIQNSAVTIADTTGNMAGVGTLSSGAITSSALTSGRVPYAGTAGLIQDSANLTFDGTNLTVNGTAYLGGTSTTQSLRVTPVASAVNYVEIRGQATTGSPQIYAKGSDTNIFLEYYSKGTGNHLFYTNGEFPSRLQQFVIAHTASAVNYLQVNGAATGTAVTLSAQGSDAGVSMAHNTKGTGQHIFGTGGGTQFIIDHTASSVNYLQPTGAATGSSPVIYAAGADANLDIKLVPKGDGYVVVDSAYSPNLTLTDAATIAWNTGTAGGQVATFTFVSSNRTMGAPTNLKNGGFYALAVIQNAGSNTLTWNAVFKWAGGTAPTLSTAAGAKDYFVFRSDGTSLFQQGISQAVA